MFWVISNVSIRRGCLIWYIALFFFFFFFNAPILGNLRLVMFFLRLVFLSLCFSFNGGCSLGEVEFFFRCAFLSFFSTCSLSLASSSVLRLFLGLDSMDLSLALLLLPRSLTICCNLERVDWADFDFEGGFGLGSFFGCTTGRSGLLLFGFGLGRTG